MIVHSYVIAMPDDCDVLPDALSSLAHFSDRIYVVDGGMGGGTLCHHPRHIAPLSESVFGKRMGEPEFGDRTLLTNWGGVPLTMWEHGFTDPAHQRNYILSRMLRESIQPDWIVWIDSDEVCSWEFIKGVRVKLESLTPDVVGVYVKRLNLVQDELHCVDSSQSNWLSHPTIHRPGVATHEGNWHESMVIDRNRLDRWDVWGIVHTRAYYRKRLYIQRGHSGIVSGGTPFWRYVHMEEIPKGVTWPALHPPDGEIIPFPFHGDASKVWDDRTGDQTGEVEW